MGQSSEEIIFDWNVLEKRGPLSPNTIEFYDETLRDGVQSPSVTDRRSRRRSRSCTSSTTSAFRTPTSVSQGRVPERELTCCGWCRRSKTTTSR